MSAFDKSDGIVMVVVVVLSGNSSCFFPAKQPRLKKVPMLL
jgi:hypothetical protein